MLIKKEPVGHLKIDKAGHIEIEHYSDGQEKTCLYCGELTKKRRLGSPECEECFEYGYKKCSKCKYGFRASTFHCNGNDLEDHFTFYTACKIRNDMGELQKTPKKRNNFPSWHVSPIERKKCFKKKEVKEISGINN